jgi:hypothetical protein
VTYSVMDDYFPPMESGSAIMGEEWSVTTRRGVLEIRVVRRVLVPQMITVSFTFPQGGEDA